MLSNFVESANCKESTAPSFSCIKERVWCSASFNLLCISIKGTLCRDGYLSFLNSGIIYGRLVCLEARSDDNLLSFFGAGLSFLGAGQGCVNLDDPHGLILLCFP